MESTEEYIQTFAPINVVKSDNEDSKNSPWRIEGLASTPSVDVQGEKIVPEGIDYKSYFMDNGWINYEHQHEDEDVIGIPLEARTTSKGLYLKAELLKDMPKAQTIWQLQKSLSKSSTNRHLGFSIEGTVTGRDKKDHNTVTGVKLVNVAITSHPANTDAKWHPIAKSVIYGGDDNTGTIGYEVDPNKLSGISALRRSSVSSAIKVLSYTLGKADSDEILQYAQEALDNSGYLDKNSLAMILQLGRGLSKLDAMSFVDEMIDNTKENKL